MRVCSFSGGVVSEAAADNLRNNGHISLVPSYKQFQQQIRARTTSFTWRAGGSYPRICLLIQDLSSCKENSVILYRPRNPWASMR